MTGKFLALSLAGLLIPAIAQAATLLTVSGGGTVSTNIFATETQCEDAASILLTGRTVADEKKFEESYWETRRLSDDAWAKNHPPRAPKGSFETQIVRDCKAGTIFLSGSGITVHLTKSCEIRDDNPQYSTTEESSGGYPEDRGEWSEYEPWSGFVIHMPTDIKTAKCLP